MMDRPSEKSHSARLRPRLSAVVLGLSLVAGALPLAGCAREQRCLPSRLTVSPTTVRIGGSLVLSSAAFDCHASYPPGKSYAVIVGFGGRASPKSLGSVPVHEDGSFRATLAIPADAAPGVAYLTVEGSAYDDPCDDTASCASYTAPVITLQR